MPLEFRKATLPDDIPTLRQLDLQLFGEANAFDENYWLKLESFWILVDGEVAGCTALSHNVDFQSDVQEDQENVPQEGSLYIATTGLQPSYRGRSLGNEIKRWQIAYAKQKGFKRIVTNCRESNTPILSLNKKFGFRAIRTTPAYYIDPTEATVIMELLL